MTALNRLFTLGKSKRELANMRKAISGKMANDFARIIKEVPPVEEDEVTDIDDSEAPVIKRITDGAEMNDDESKESKNPESDEIKSDKEIIDNQQVAVGSEADVTNTEAVYMNEPHITDIPVIVEDEFEWNECEKMLLESMEDSITQQSDKMKSDIGIIEKTIQNYEDDVVKTQGISINHKNCTGNMMKPHDDEEEDTKMEISESEEEDIADTDPVSETDEDSTVSGRDKPLVVVRKVPSTQRIIHIANERRRKKRVVLPEEETTCRKNVARTKANFEWFSVVGREESGTMPLEKSPKWLKREISNTSELTKETSKSSVETLFAPMKGSRYSDDRGSNNSYPAARKNGNNPKGSQNSSNIGKNQGKKSTIRVVDEKKKCDKQKRKNKDEPWKGRSQICLQMTKMATPRKYRNDDNNSDDDSDEDSARMIAKTSKKMKAAPRIVQKSAIPLKNAHRPKNSQNSSDVGRNQGKKSTIPVINEEKKKRDKKEKKNKDEPWKGMSRICLQTMKMATHRRYRNDDNNSDDDSDEGIAMTPKKKRPAQRDVQENSSPMKNPNSPKSNRNSPNVRTYQGKKSTVPVVSKGNTAVERKRGKNADPYDFEENETDMRESPKRGKEGSVPVKRSLSFLSNNKQNTNDACNNDDQSSSPTVECITSLEREKSSPTLHYSPSRGKRLNNAVNEVRKVITSLNKKFRNIQRLLEAESSEGSDFEMAETSMYDETTGEIEIAPGWRMSSVEAIRAASASSMAKRLYILMSSLWDKDERGKLIIKKKKGDGNDERREVTWEEIKHLMRGCMSLQNMRELPMDGVEDPATVKSMISKKLKNDRYYSSRGKGGMMRRRVVSDTDEGDDEDDNEDNNEEDNDDEDNDDENNDYDYDDDDNDNDAHITKN